MPKTQPDEITIEGITLHGYIVTDERTAYIDRTGNLVMPPPYTEQLEHAVGRPVGRGDCIISLIGDDGRYYTGLVDEPTYWHITRMLRNTRG